MILQVFSVFDLKARAFSQPFFLPSEGLALRAWGEALKAPGNAISKYPEDHRLYMLGQFDDETAEFSLLPQPRLIAQGVSQEKVDVSKGA